MMCHEARNRLDLFMDGELAVEENLKVLEHLNLCRPCAEVFEAEKSLREGLREQMEEKAPAALAGKIRAAMDRPRRRWWIPAAGAATVLVALAVLLVLPPRQAFAAAAVEYHEASRQAPVGESICLRQCCCGEAEKKVCELAKGKAECDPCVHSLDSIGYSFRSASLQKVRGRMLCWTQQQNAEGQLISHTLVPEKLAEEPMKIWEANGRTVVLFTKPNGFT